MQGCRGSCENMPTLYRAKAPHPLQEYETACGAGDDGGATEKAPADESCGRLRKVLQRTAQALGGSWALAPSTIFIAEAIMPEMSPRVPGTMSVLLVFASCEKASTYF